MEQISSLLDQLDTIYIFGAFPLSVLLASLLSALKRFTEIDGATARRIVTVVAVIFVSYISITQFTPQGILTGIVVGFVFVFGCEGGYHRFARQVIEGKEPKHKSQLAQVAGGFDGN